MEKLTLNTLSVTEWEKVKTCQLHAQRHVRSSGGMANLNMTITGLLHKQPRAFTSTGTSMACYLKVILHWHYWMATIKHQIELVYSFFSWEVIVSQSIEPSIDWEEFFAPDLLIPTLCRQNEELRTKWISTGCACEFAWNWSWFHLFQGKINWNMNFVWFSLICVQFSLDFYGICDSTYDDILKGSSKISESKSTAFHALDHLSRCKKGGSFHSHMLKKWRRMHCVLLYLCHRWLNLFFWSKCCYCHQRSSKMCRIQFRLRVFITHIPC